jgi:hypothetical protein
MGAILSAIEKNPKEIKRLLGIDQEQLRQLVAQAELIHSQKQEEIERNKLRVNKKGGGKKPKLSPQEQILLTLVYLRHSPTFQLLGIQFGVSETTANDIFHYWLPIISEALPPSLLEQVKKFEGDYEWLQELLSEVQLIVDTSEQARERPRDYQEQKEFYSGKKKNHTRKNQLIVLPEGKDIVDILPGVPGPKSDRNLLRERFRQFAPEQKFGGDKAYQGESQVMTPRSIGNWLSIQVDHAPASNCLLGDEPIFRKQPTTNVTPRTSSNASLYNHIRSLYYRSFITERSLNLW